MEVAGGGDLQHIVKKHIELKKLIPEDDVSKLNIKYIYEYINIKHKIRFGFGFFNYVKLLSIYI